MPSRVLWSEGLLLTPQHLQLWERLQDELHWGRLRSVAMQSEGVVAFDLDPAALVSGTLQATRITAVLSDGTLIDAPQLDPLPPPRALPVAGVGPMGVMVAVPRRAAADGVSGLPPDAEGTGLALETWKVQSPHGKGKIRPVDVTRTVPVWVLEGEGSAHLTPLKVAELTRDGAGSWQQSGRYVPSLLRTSASPVLVGMMEEVFTLLVARRRLLLERRGTNTPKELMYADMLLFWFQYSVNESIATLRHAMMQEQMPPERIFEQLRRLAGQLTTFGAELSPLDLPNYRRDDLFGSFRAMIDLLRRLLDAVLPPDNLRIALAEQKDRHLWTARIPAEVAMDVADHILILSGRPPADLGIEKVAQAIKIAAARDVDLVVNAAMRGVDLQPLPRAPPGVPNYHEANYFRLRNRGPFWSVLVETREFAVHLPGELGVLTPELVIVP